MQRSVASGWCSRLWLSSGTWIGFSFSCLQYDCWSSGNHLCIPNQKKERDQVQMDFPKAGKPIQELCHMTTPICKGGRGMFFGCAHCCPWENWSSMVRLGENKYRTDKQYLPGPTLLNFPSSINTFLCFHIHIPTKGHEGLWVMLSSLSCLRCGPSWPKALKIKVSAPVCPKYNGRKGQ